MDTSPSPPWMVRFAHLLSYVLHPAVLLLVTMGLLSATQQTSATVPIRDTLILLAGLLPGLIYIVIQVRRGTVGHVHLLLKEERRVVLPLFLLGFVGSLGLYWLVGAAQFIVDGVLIGIIEGVILTLITRVWKISFHAAVSMTCAAFLLPSSPLLASLMALLALITGLARLPIGHHTLAHVVAGWVFGFGVTTTLLATLTRYL